MDVGRLAAAAATVTTKASGTDQAVTPVASTPAASASAAGNLISLLADAAPPIDTKKVEAIQSLIASGAYPIDPHAIAAKMMALDLPTLGGHAEA